MAMQTGQLHYWPVQRKAALLAEPQRRGSPAPMETLPIQQLAPAFYYLMLPEMGTTAKSTWLNSSTDAGGRQQVQIFAGSSAGYWFQGRLSAHQFKTHMGLTGNDRRPATV
jgi:hypothetical protein